MPKAKKRPPELDPVFPLPANTEIYPVEQGDGRSFMLNTSPMFVSLPWRAFYIMWEQAERRARENYPKYVGGPMDHIARAHLEAVHAFRSAARGQELPLMDEKKAQRARAALAKFEKMEADAKKKAKGGEVAKGASAENDCTAVKKGVHCLGPANHKGKHKGKTPSGRKVSWS